MDVQPVRRFRAVALAGIECAPDQRRLESSDRGGEIALQPIHVRRQRARREKCEIRARYHRMPHQHGDTLHRVAQLADIAGPWISEQARRGVGRQALAVTRPPEKVLRERHDVGQPLPQRRHMHRDDSEPVKQILPEPALTHGAGEVAMGRGDDPYVDRRRFAAQRRYHPFLQHAQKLRLHCEIHVADLVEKQGASVGFPERAKPVRYRPGKGSTHMAEQLAFQQLLGDGGAVDGHEGMAGAEAVGVDSAGDHFLTRAGLARDQYRRVAIGEQADRLLHGAHPGAGTDQCVGVRNRRWSGSRLGRQHTGQQGGEIVPAHWFREMVDGAEPNRLDRVGGRGHGGQHRNSGRREPRPDAAQHLHSIQSRHAQVEQDRVRRDSFEHGQRRFAIGGFTGLVAEISQGFGKPLAKHVVVIDDQDACHGSSMVKMAPRPGASPPGRSRTTRPPCASASSRAIASPSPVPSA